MSNKISEQEFLLPTMWDKVIAIASFELAIAALLLIVRVADFHFNSETFTEYTELGLGIALSSVLAFLGGTVFRKFNKNQIPGMLAFIAMLLGALEFFFCVFGVILLFIYIGLAGGLSF